MSPDDDDLDYGLVCDCLYDGLHDDNPDGPDRNGALGADGRVYTDAEGNL